MTDRSTSLARPSGDAHRNPGCAQPPVAATIEPDQGRRSSTYTEFASASSASSAGAGAPGPGKPGGDCTFGFNEPILPVHTDASSDVLVALLDASGQRLEVSRRLQVPEVGKAILGSEVERVFQVGQVRGAFLVFLGAVEADDGQR
jgi:hypothetical protein